MAAPSGLGSGHVWAESSEWLTWRGAGGVQLVEKLQSSTSFWMLSPRHADTIVPAPYVLFITRGSGRPDKNTGKTWFFKLRIRMVFLSQTLKFPSLPHVRGRRADVAGAPLTKSGSQLTPRNEGPSGGDQAMQNRAVLCVFSNTARPGPRDQKLTGSQGKGGGPPAPC